MVHLEFYDGSGQASCEELNEYMRQKKEILTRVQAGEEQYRDSIGWLSVDEWAGEERIAEIETFAKRVRDDGDILVVIGIGGSNQAARAVTCALPNQSKVKVLYADHGTGNRFPDSQAVSEKTLWGRLQQQGIRNRDERKRAGGVVCGSRLYIS